MTHHRLKVQQSELFKTRKYTFKLGKGPSVQETQQNGGVPLVQNRVFHTAMVFLNPTQEANLTKSWLIEI